MAIFNDSIAMEGYGGMEYEGIYEGKYSGELDNNTDIIIESYDDQLAIMEAMHRYDMLDLIKRKRRIAMESSYDDEDIDDDELDTAMEASLRGIWDKIKAAIKKLWEKIKAFFAAVLRFFVALFASGETFVKKYEAQLTQLNLSGYKFDMYNYTHLEDTKTSETIKTKIDAQTTKITTALNTALQSVTAAGIDYDINNDDHKNNKDINSASEDVVKLANELDNMKEPDSLFRLEIMSACIGGNSIKDESDFADELFKYFRSGKDKTTEMPVNISTSIKILKDTKNLKNAVVKNSENFNNVMDKLNKTIKNIEKVAVNAENKNCGSDNAEKYTNLISAKCSGIASKTVGLVTCATSIGNQAINAQKSAMKECLKTHKSICVKAFSYKAS